MASLIVVGIAISACTTAVVSRATSAPSTAPTPAVVLPAPPPPATVAGPNPAGAKNIYAAATSATLSAAAAKALPYVYVPSTIDGSVTVIDQATMTVVEHYKVGTLVQHVVPSWDLTTLYANASGSNHLVPIDPTTGKAGTPIPIDAPYNLYFTPDGSRAVVMAERHNRIDYYDPHTWRLLFSVAAPCDGVNHADWSADGSFFVVTCEFSGQLLKVDTATGQVKAVVAMAPGAMPQDVRLAPDGSKFYVADMMHGDISILSADGVTITGSIPTGIGTHGIYPSRDGHLFYISNRGRLMGDEKRRSRPGDGSVSVVDPSTDTVVATWPIAGGGSPDMGGVSADGRVLWLSGRYDAVVYAIDTTTGKELARIPVPKGPHGLCVFPQPGRYSLGHTGNTR